MLKIVKKFKSFNNIIKKALSLINTLIVVLLVVLPHYLLAVINYQVFILIY